MKTIRVQGASPIIQPPATAASTSERPYSRAILPVARRSPSVLGACAVPMLATTSLLLCLATFASQFEEVTAGAGLLNESTYCISAAWGDYNNDGYPDLYITGGATGPDVNALYQNNGDGTFTLKTGIEAGPIADDSHDSFGCAWIDFNNDGFQDMFVANGGWSASRNDLYWNNGDGTFRSGSAGDLTSANRVRSWHAPADYDGDGWVDLYAPEAPSGSGPFAMRLYHATGSGTFTPVDFGPTVGYANDGVWGDFDNDGDLDLFSCNYTSPTSLWRNDGQGKFTKLTNGLPANAQTLHATWADFDNDGDLDIALSSWSGTQLYRNNGTYGFASVTNLSAAYAGGAWADYDNDGNLDFLAAGGQGFPRAAALYHNNGDGTFTSVSDVFTATADYWLACPWGDYDNDGFMDVLLTQQYGQNRLYHNLTNANHWIKFKLVGTLSNRDAIGAKVRLQATIRGKNVWQFQEVNGGHMQQNDRRLNFGLGDATKADLVRIEWPSGRVQQFTNVVARQILTVTEPSRLLVTGPGKFQFRSWKGMRFEVQASTNLLEWSALGTITNVNGTLNFEDPDVASHARRFYRVLAK